MLDLARPDQFTDRACDIFNRSQWVDPGLIEEIDVVGAQSLERRVSNSLDLVGRLSTPIGEAPPFGSNLNPNLVEITTWSRRGSSASPTNSSLVWGP